MLCLGKGKHLTITHGVRHQMLNSNGLKTGNLVSWTYIFIRVVSRIKTCGATRKPESPRTKLDRTETSSGSGHIFENISGRVGDKDFRPVRVRLFFTGVSYIFSDNFRKLSGIRWKPCLAFPTWVSTASIGHLLACCRMLLLHFWSYSQVCWSPKRGYFGLMIKYFSPIRIR